MRAWLLLIGIGIALSVPGATAQEAHGFGSLVQPDDPDADRKLITLEAILLCSVLDAPLKDVVGAALALEGVQPTGILLSALPEYGLQPGDSQQAIEAAGLLVEDCAPAPAISTDSDDDGVYGDVDRTWIIAPALAASNPDTIVNAIPGIQLHDVGPGTAGAIQSLTLDAVQRVAVFDARNHSVAYFDAQGDGIAEAVYLLVHHDVDPWARLRLTPVDDIRLAQVTPAPTSSPPSTSSILDVGPRVVFLAGLVGLLAVPALGQRFGDGAAGAATVVSLLLMLSVAGLAPGTWFAGLSTGTVLWVAAVYVAYRVRRPGRPRDLPRAVQAMAAVLLFHGGVNPYARSHRSWRTHLHMAFSCEADGDTVRQSAVVEGGVFQGLWYTARRVALAPTVRFGHAPGRGAFAVEEGTVEETAGMLRVAVRNDVHIDRDAPAVRLRVTFEAAMEARGPIISASHGPFSGQTSLPDASLAVVRPSGDIVWHPPRGAAGPFPGVANDP